MVQLTDGTSRILLHACFKPQEILMMSWSSIDRIHTLQRIRKSQYL